MNLELTIYRSLGECYHLREEWENLLRDSADATPFETYAWCKANLESFENRGIQLLVFRRGDRSVAGIIPLVLRRGRRYLRTRIWLEFASLPYADYGASIVKRGFELQVARQLVEHLRGGQAEWDGTCLDKLRDGSFSRALAEAAQSEGLQVTDSHGYEVRRLAKQDRASERYTRSLDKDKKKLGAQGELRFEVQTSRREIEQRLEVFFQLHIERFAVKGMKSQFLKNTQREFYRRVVEECAPQGLVWLSALFCGENVVAMRFSLRYGEALHLYATCFAQRFARYSPSQLLLEMLLDYAFAHGIEVVDFGIGESPHKQQSGATVQRKLIQMELYASRQPMLESRIYRAAERRRESSALLHNGGAVLRKLLPYRM
jgi:CelD/BcsL family acetyltransferase involved in cellulose biosynthesis